jgi:hypothetical protein
MTYTSLSTSRPVTIEESPNSYIGGETKFTFFDEPAATPTQFYMEETNSWHTLNAVSIQQTLEN